MKSLRNDEIVELNLQIQKISDENKRLQKELGLIQNLAEAQKDTISFAKDNVRQLKFIMSQIIWVSLIPLACYKAENVYTWNSSHEIELYKYMKIILLQNSLATHPGFRNGNENTTAIIRFDRLV